jgi:hypothetical protein
MAKWSLASFRATIANSRPKSLKRVIIRVVFYIDNTLLAASARVFLIRITRPLILILIVSPLSDLP